MKNSISILLAALAILTGETFAAKPNIIVIFTDDHGWPDIGAQSIYDDLKTPHIDALAASGIRATSGYVTAPQCIPSRAGLLTGKSQNRFGVESNGQPLDGFNREQTIAERLKKAGYTTAQIGKWHLGPGAQIGDHGFDYFYNKNINRPCNGNFDLDSGEKTDTRIIQHERYHIDDCSRAAVTFIRRHAKQPFFLYLAYRAPHVPLDAPKHHLARFPGKMPERRRQALAMIAAMDDGVGAITKGLKEHGIDKNTLIFFMGDNGAPLKIHKLDAPGGGPGWDGSLNKPMNGEKGMLSEGGIRVPFVVSWPGKIPGKQIYDHPIWSLDVAATAIELAGLPADEELDGVNLIPHLSGENKNPPHDALTWRWIAQSAIRAGKWKLLRGGEREYLFDLETDPGEQKNLAAAKPEIAARLRKQLTSWSNELQPPGLTSTGKLSDTWNRYFDFYLDGKAPPPVRGKQDSAKNAQGWLARSAKLRVENSALQVVPEKPRAFLVKNGLMLKGLVTSTIELQNKNGGELAIAWREEGQKDFQPNQTAKKSMTGSDEFQKVEIELPSKGTVIHVRVIVPSGRTAIRKIQFGSSNKAESWNFTEPEHRKKR